MLELTASIQDNFRQRRLIQKINQKLPDTVIIHIIEYCLIKETNETNETNETIVTRQSNNNCKIWIILILYMVCSYFLGSLFTGNYLFSMILINLFIGFSLILFTGCFISLFIIVVFGKKIFNNIVQRVLPEMD